MVKFMRSAMDQEGGDSSFAGSREHVCIGLPQWGVSNQRCQLTLLFWDISMSLSLHLFALQEKPLSPQAISSHPARLH